MLLDCLCPTNLTRCLSYPLQWHWQLEPKKGTQKKQDGADFEKSVGAVDDEFDFAIY